MKCVINYDYPEDWEDYLQRINRTVRANNTGTAYTLFTEHDADKAGDLIQVLKEANQVRTISIWNITKQFLARNISEQKNQ